MGQTKNCFFILATLKKAVGMVSIFLAICLLAGTFGGQAVAGEFLDQTTQHAISIPFGVLPQGVESVHVCPCGCFMTGVHIQDNRFLCEDGITDARGGRYTPSEIRVNASPGAPRQRYQSHGMAACPPGTAMVGLHEGKNALLCAPLETTELFVDSYTQRLGMKACPIGTVMVGIDVGRNLLLCGRPR